MVRPFNLHNLAITQEFFFFFQHIFLREGIVGRGSLWFWNRYIDLELGPLYPFIWTQGRNQPGLRFEKEIHNLHVYSSVTKYYFILLKKSVKYIVFLEGLKSPSGVPHFFLIEITEQTIDSFWCPDWKQHQGRCFFKKCNNKFSRGGWVFSILTTRS